MTPIAPALPTISLAQKSSPLTAIVLSALLSACGGGSGGMSDSTSGGGGGGDSFSGGSSGNGGSGNAPPAAGWTRNQFNPSSQYANRCAAPRSGIDPFTNLEYPDQPGTALDEKNWLRSWTHELYLWYSEVPDANPAVYPTVLGYFDTLKTPLATASGQPKDKFHFTYPTAEWQALSQGGVQAGYGARWEVLSGVPPRDIRIAFTEPGTPATVAMLARGAQVLAIDGIDAVNTNDPAQIDALNAALWPDNAGESHSFTVLDAGSMVPRAVSLTSADITSAPVQNVGTVNSGGATVGYLLFNDHIATAEQQLVDAVNTLALAGISDLVIDIRYNGGGYLDIAAEFAYMIAGPALTTGFTFEALQFNDQHPTTNPVTGAPLAPVPFHAVAQGFSAAVGVPLPTLNLPRVFVLTGEGTCSASEAIMNGLRGVNVEVIQIGSTTCGKPYGFYAFDNCGTTYFSIQFRGVNQQGFGDYADGFAPANSGGTLTTPVPGCSVGDDFAHALGDPAEARFAAALNYRLTQTCPAPSGFAPRRLQQQRDTGLGLSAPARPWLENRIMR